MADEPLYYALLSNPASVRKFLGVWILLVFFQHPAWFISKLVVCCFINYVSEKRPQFFVQNLFEMQ